MKTSEIRKKFGKRVQYLRLQKGISSQMALANKAGMDRTYVGGIERGERNVALDNIAKLAKAIGVDLVELFKF